MRTRSAAFFITAALAVPTVSAASADVSEGRRLVQEKKCETCHEAKVPGEPGAIYRRDGRRVTTWEKLKAQVAVCNSELGLGLFPEEEEQVARYLDETYYRLKK